MLAPEDSLEVLGREECRRLLESAPTGRVGFTARALPAVQPVRLGVHDGRIVFPAAPSGRLAAGCRGAVVAVEADGDSDGTAWSVEVVGAAHVLTDPARVADLDGLLLAGTRPPAHCYVAVDMELISGWRVAAPGSRPAVTSADDDDRAIA